MKVANGLFTLEVPEQGAVKGHVRLEAASTDPQDIAVMGMCANVLSSLLFERLQAQGTNIIIHVGAETRLEVLARTEQDGLDFHWAPKQVERLADIQERIRNKTFFIGKEPAKQPGPVAELAVVEEVGPAPGQSTDEREEDELVKHLYRVP